MGGVKRRIRLWRAGSWGATYGAATAAPMTMKRIRAPAMAAGLRASLRQARERSMSERAEGTATVGGARVPTDMARSAHPDLRVQVKIEHIDGEVDEDDDEGEEKDAGLDDGKVELTDGAHDEPPQPGHGEHGLGDHGATQEQAELEPGQGHEGERGIDKSMVADDKPLRDALGPRGAHVVEVDHLEH